jgi:hypothetical protein
MNRYGEEFHILYSLPQDNGNKEDKMGLACSKHGENRQIYVYRILFVKHITPVRRCEYDKKVGFTRI